MSTTADLTVPSPRSLRTSRPQIDAACDVVTPENIAFEYRLAGPLRRLPAFAIDVLIRFAVIAVVAFGLTIFLAITLGELGMLIAMPVLLLMRFAFEWLYGGFFETYWNGQTPGKWLLGIRVLSTNGQPISGWQAMLRNILRFTDMMPFIPYAAFASAFAWDQWEPGNGWPIFIAMLCPMPMCMVGLIVPALNRRWQRLGDIPSRTMVVIEERPSRANVTKFSDQRVRHLASDLPHIEASRSLSRALALYVERRDRFSPARRQEIAMHLGRPLVARYGLPAVPDQDLLLCAVYLRVFMTDQQGDMSELGVGDWQTPPVRGGPARQTGHGTPAAHGSQPLPNWAIRYPDDPKVDLPPIPFDSGDNKDDTFSESPFKDFVIRDSQNPDRGDRR